MSFFNPTPSVSVTEAAQKVRENKSMFIDVRTPEEYAGGHAQGSQNYPLGVLDTLQESLKPVAEVYVICQSGGRSAAAVSKLRSANINAINVTGGTSAWRAQGLPIV